MLNQGMKSPQDSRNQFLEAMVKEFNDHCERGHLVIGILHQYSYRGTKMSKDYWFQMVYEGEMWHQDILINYFEIYAPVVNWFSVRLFMTHSNLWTKTVQSQNLVYHSGFSCPLVGIPSYKNRLLWTLVKLNINSVTANLLAELHERFLMLGNISHSKYIIRPSFEHLNWQEEATKNNSM